MPVPRKGVGFPVKGGSGALGFVSLLPSKDEPALQVKKHQGSGFGVSGWGNRVYGRRCLAGVHEGSADSTPRLECCFMLKKPDSEDF